MLQPDLESAAKLLSEGRSRCILCDPPEDRVVARTENFVVMAGLGPIRPGYALLFTRTHVPAFSHLPDELWDEFRQMEERLRSCLSAFGPHLVRYEHGQIGSCLVEGEGSTRHCHHAHRVFVPWNEPLEVEPDLPGTRVALESPRQLTEIREHYIFLDDQVFVIPDGTVLPSQYMRRWLLRELGREREYCWAQYPRHGDALIVAAELRELWSSQ